MDFWTAELMSWEVNEETEVYSLAILAYIRKYTYLIIDRQQRQIDEAIKNGFALLFVNF